MPKIANKPDAPAQFSFGKSFLFSILPLLLLLVFAEITSFAYLWVKGEIRGNLKFHPLFRTLDFSRQNAFSGSRFTFDPFLGFRYVPNTRYGNLTINSHGFIGNGGVFPDLEHKPQDTTRIFLFGGSSVAGSGASSNRATISAHMERLLNEQTKKRYEVINAGIDGYFSYNEFSYFVTNIARYAPDHVVFYDGWNDYAYSTWVGGYTSDYQKDCCWPNHHEYALYLLLLLPHLEKESLRMINPQILHKTYTTFMLQRVLEKIKGHSLNEGTLNVRNWPGKRTLSPEEAANRYRYFVENTLASLQSRGLKVTYVLQPTLLHKVARTQEEILLESHRLFGRNTPENIHRFYRAAQTHFKELAARYTSPTLQVLDLSSSMWQNTQETVYIDEIHTNDTGNTVIAKALVEAIRQLEIPSRQTPAHN